LGLFGINVEKNLYLINSFKDKAFFKGTECKKGDHLKKILAVGILVVLALAFLNVLSLPQVRAQTDQAQVVSYSWYVAPSTTTTAVYINDLIAVGEVQNTGSTTLGAVWVIGQAYNSSGIAVASSETRVMAPNLAPNQKAPFYLDFIPENSITLDQSWVSDVTTVTASVFTVLDPTGTGNQNAGLTTSILNSANTNGTYTVSGTITNSGDQTVLDVALVTTFYNSSGTVVGVSFTDLGAGFSPGQSMPFSVTPSDNTDALSSKIASFAILIQAVPVTPTPTPQPTTQPTSSPNYSTNPTENSGVQGSIPTYTILIVVVAVIAILALLIVLRRQNNRHNIEAPRAPPPLPQP
jgi:hypothetical protein